MKMAQTKEDKKKLYISVDVRHHDNQERKNR